MSKKPEPSHEQMINEIILTCFGQTPKFIHRVTIGMAEVFKLERDKIKLKKTETREKTNEEMHKRSFSLRVERNLILFLDALLLVKG